MNLPARAFLQLKKLFVPATVILLIFLSCILSPGIANGQKHYDFNNNCQQAYREIVQLRLNAGQRILDDEKRKDPDNLIPAFLENYIDFFNLFFNEDPAEYQARKDNLDKRIGLMNEGPASSPFHLFTKSVIHFQWAAIKVKFGNNWDAGWEFRRCFIQSKDNMKDFPGFAPANMLYGAMQVVAGTIPDGYKWLSGLLGIKGNIRNGMQQLDQFLVKKDPWALLYRDEAIFYYLYLKFYIENKHEEVFTFIRQNKLDVKNNYLFAYLSVNLALNDQQSVHVRPIIEQKSNGPDYLKMPVWDLEMGYAGLNHLDPDAHIYLERFLKCFKGQFYVKDALQKLSWHYYLQGDDRKADAVRGQILSRGGVESDADKLALKEAKSGNWPNRILLRARLLSDGGYYKEALQSLNGKSSSDFGQPEDRCEFAYRLGRIYDGLGKRDEAIAAYLTTIKTGEFLKEYYAARAALQTGYLYERQGDRQTAVTYFQKCLAMKEHDYKNSLDQKAKAGLERCRE